jgi:hypothetical protein
MEHMDRQLEKRCEEVAKKSGIPLADLRKAACLFETPEEAMIFLQLVHEGKWTLDKTAAQ